MAAEPQFRGPEPGAHPPPPDHPKHGPAEAVYTYRDAAGQPLYYVCRFKVPAKREGERDEKTFLQGHYKADGKWVWNLRGVEPILYRLPELLEHLARNEEHAPLYIIEGEKAVEYLRRYLTQHALPGEATCNPMGAGKWRDSYTDTLTGARYVVVVADNDTPGFNGARKVNEELGPHVGRLELTRPALQDEHAGVDDHLAAGHRLEELLELEAEATARLEVRTLPAFIADKDEEAAAPLVGDAERALVPRAGLVVVGGQGGAAKTTYTLDAVAHLAAGAPWEGLAVERPLRVLLIDVEGPREPYRQKLERKVNVWPGPAFAQNVYVLDGPSWGRFSFADLEDQRRLVATCRELRIDLVVANPLGRLGMEGGGTPDEVGRFVEHLRACGLWDSLAFWLIHHFNRGLGRDVLMRLSGAWDRDADTIIGLARDGEARKTKRTWAKVRWAHDGGPEDVTEVLEWDVEHLGFRKVEAAPAATLEEVRGRVLEWLAANPGEHAKSEVRRKVKGRDAFIDQALQELYEEGLAGLAVGPAKKRPLTVGPEDWADWAVRRVPTYWEACTYAASEVGRTTGPTGADSDASTPGEVESRPVGPDPVGGGPAGGPTPAEVTDQGSGPHQEELEERPLEQQPHEDDIPW